MREGRSAPLGASGRAAPRMGSGQATLEYALVVAAVLAMVVAIGAIWRAGERGVLVQLVKEAVSHVLGGTGALDIALF